MAGSVRRSPIQSGVEVMTRIAVCVALLCVLSMAAVVALAEPEPSPVRVSWELTFEPTPPLRIQVGSQTYWYMLYTVTNETGEDIAFHPEITRVNEIETELTAEQAKAQPKLAPRLTVDPAIVGLQSSVFKAIKDRHAKTHPFLVTPVRAIGKLLQGKDNARTSVMVFRDLDPRVSKFTVYVAGLSGERITKPNPKYDPRRKAGEDNEEFFVLRKTLAMPYTLAGDVKTRAAANPKLGKMTWIMR